MIDISSLWQEWLSNYWLTWGVGPVVVYIAAFLLSAIPLELMLRSPALAPSLITYSKTSRAEALSKTFAKVPFMTQVHGVVMSLIGPAALINGALGALLFHFLIGTTKYPLLPDVGAAIVQIIVMELLGDFFLYWGHRIQHEIPYLWENFHSLHHTLDTPSPLGTIYIHSVDASLQGGIPILLSGLIMQPHPLTFYIYVALRIAENTLNHSGIDNFWLNLITLKVLPGRASIAHHDSHHKYSNYGRMAKNYGENFWIWDYVFGTYRPTGKKA